jgi:ribosomal protein S27AE
LPETGADTMPSRVTSCPNCGGTVEFKAGSSLLAVCSYCRSAVARVGDDIGELEILGQVAPLADIGSPLSVGASGRYQGRGFTLVGRMQLDHGAGPWNEWYAAFDDGSWGWISEAQGRVYALFARPVAGMPGFAHWRVGTRFAVEGKNLVVTERRRASFVSAEGELPAPIQPGMPLFYCDVEGSGNVFGTLDFGANRGELEALYLGEELRYDQLFGQDLLRDVAAGQAAGAVGMNCPNCGSGVELRAPDEAQRVTCEACGSLLDCSKGHELYLLHAAKRKGPEPLIPLGSVGERGGKKYTVFGHMVRSVTVEGVKYAWEEYLLHTPGIGYRWLVNNDNHWTWVDPARAADANIVGLNAHIGSTRYRHFQSAAAKVEVLRGEFYWKVSVGDRTAVTDWVSPPKVLSRERSDDEVSWSMGEYVESADVQAMFKLKKSLPRPLGVAANQPNPNLSARQSSVTLAALFTVLAILIGIGVAASSDNRVIYQGSHPVVRVNAADKDAVASQVVVTEPFELRGPTNLSMRVDSAVQNTWVYVAAALIEEGTGEVRQFGAEVAYYSGYSGGESWSEGSRKETVYVGRVPSGTYVLRLQPMVDANMNAKLPNTYSVEVRADVFLPSHLFALLFFIWIGPVWASIRYWSFEKRRWSQSDHA